MTPPRDSTDRDRRWIGGLLGAGLALRILYVVVSDFDSDQALLGLISHHILKGEHPAFVWDAPFVGTLQCYLTAALMLPLGRGALAAELSPVLFSMLFAVSAYLFTRQTVGRREALWTLALVCLGPPYLIETSTRAAVAIEVLALGTLALCFAARALGAENRGQQRSDLAAVGFLIGLALWSRGNAAWYALAILVFWAVEKPWILFPAAFWSGGAFAIGATPVWYQVARFGLPDAPTVDTSLVARLVDCVAGQLPALVGMLAAGPVVGVALAVLQLSSFAAVVQAARFPVDSPFRRGARLIALFAAVSLVIHIASPFSAVDGQRLLVPLYTVLAVAPAFLIVRLGGLLGRGAALVGLALVALQVLPALGAAPVFDAVARSELRAREVQDRGLLQRLDELGIAALYSDDRRDAARLTFGSAERVIFANPFSDPQPLYLDFVDGADRVAFLFHRSADDFEAALALAGASYEHATIFDPVLAPYHLYHSFQPRPRGGAELPIAAAGASENREDSLLVFDRDAGTRWRSLAPRQPGMWLELDLGEERTVAQVLVWPRARDDSPPGLSIEASIDGSTWQPVVKAETLWGPLSWARGRPVTPPDGWVDARFEPVRCRRLRLTLLAGGGNTPWAIAEVIVREPAAAEDPAPPSTMPKIFQRLLSDPVTAAKLRRARRYWQGKTVEAIADVHSGFRITADSTLLVPRTRGGEVEERLRGLGVRFSHSEPISEALIFAGPDRDVDRLETEQVEQWTLDPQKQIMRIDLGGDRAVAGVALRHGSAVEQFPRGLVARTSSDGQSWSAAEPLVARPEELYWSLEGVMGASVRRRIFLFAEPRRARFVELAAEPRNPWMRWAAKSVDVLQPGVLAEDYPESPSASAIE